MRTCPKCNEPHVADDGYCAARCREITMPSFSAPPCSTCGADGVRLTNGFCTGCWTARLESAVNIGMLELMAVESTPASRGEASARMAKLIMSNEKVSHADR